MHTQFSTAKFELYNIKRTIEKFNGQMKISSQTPLFVLEMEFKVK